MEIDSIVYYARNDLSLGSGFGTAISIRGGPGIKEDILDKIFVPYFTTKQGGSGIGLALTRQIMTYHGGFIRTANREKGGASFKLIF